MVSFSKSVAAQHGAAAGRQFACHPSGEQVMGEIRQGRGVRGAVGQDVAAAAVGRVPGDGFDPGGRARRFRVDAGVRTVRTACAPWARSAGGRGSPSSPGLVRSVSWAPADRLMWDLRSAEVLMAINGPSVTRTALRGDGLRAS